MLEYERVDGRDALQAYLLHWDGRGREETRDSPQRLKSDYLHSVSSSSLVRGARWD